MIIRRATSADRGNVISILSASFDANPAVNDTISPGGSRAKKLQALMEYLVDTGYARNGVYITSDQQGAFILFDPTGKSSGIAETFRQLKLIQRCIGWSRLKYASSKDKKMRSFRPASPHLYLSMIGTHPAAQGKGVGSQMLRFILNLSAETSRAVYLETSVRRNVEMYLRYGFTVHGDWKIREDYHVHFMQWKSVK